MEQLFGESIMLWFLLVLSLILFLAGTIGYFKVSSPLASLPTYEDLRYQEEMDKKAQSK